MYTCPECGCHNVKVSRWVPIIEYWDGDDVTTEDDMTYERSPEEGSVECLECGYESPDIDEWYI